MTLQSKIIATVSGLVVFLMLVLALFTIRHFETGLKEQIFHQQMQLVTEMADRIDERLYTARDFLAARAAVLHPRALRSRQASLQFLDASTGLHKLYDNHLFLFSARGRLLVESPPLPGRPSLPQALLDCVLLTIRTREANISEAYRDEQLSPGPAVAIAIPVFGPAGEFKAVIAGSLDLKKDMYLGKLSRLKIGQTGYLSLSTADQTMVMHPDPARIFQRTELATKAFYERVLEGVESSGESVNAGVTMLVSYKRLKAKNWVLAANYPIGEAYAPIERIKSIYSLFLLFSCVAVALALTVLLRRLTRPLVTMTRHVQALPGLTGQERYIPVTTTDEIGVLSRSFNEMIDELDRKQDSLLRSEELHRTMTQFATDLIFCKAVDKKLIFISQSCLAVTGYGEQDFYADPGLLDRIIHPEDRQRWLDHARGADFAGVHEPLDFRLVHRDGSTRWISHVCTTIPGKNGEKAGIRGSHSDITERKKLEEQLRHSQKLEAVGQLAGGVAHDFNNILSVIAGYAGILKKHLGQEERLRPYIEEIITSTKRAAGVTQSLLAFSRKQAAELRPVDLNQVIRDFEKMITRIIGEDASVRTALAAEELVIEADIGQIEQVFLNLATNARDAMPRGGVLSITTASVLLDERQCRTAALQKPGGYALVTVADTGHGMTRAVQEHIFEPFYTTKAVGRGTGLGLSIVYGIVSKHNGAIHAYSEPGQGTEFKIYLPLVQKAGLTVRDEKVASPGGNETILLIEDDEAVRKVAGVILQEGGYSVIEAKDGDEAVALFQQFRERLGLVLCDVMLPARGGMDVCAEIERIQPGTKVIFMSGYTREFLAQKGVSGESHAILSKPLDQGELLRTVRVVLGPAR